MNTYKSRMSRLEAQAGLAARPKAPVVVYMHEQEDAEQLVASALRERGLRSDEARVIVVQWVAPKK